MGERVSLCAQWGCALAISAFAFAGAAAADPLWSELPLTPHVDFQAVDANGNGTFPVNTSGPIRMRGILLNDPEDMLDTAAGAPAVMGGQWQAFFQAAAPGDYGGTAMFMAQYLGKRWGTHPIGSYTDAEWQGEVQRLSHDPATGHAFRPGDLIEIRARAPGLFYCGKTNINEQHSTDPAVDFEVHLVQAGYGLPAPALLSLADLKDAADAFLFDEARLAGPERYQGTLVRLSGVRLRDASGWGPDGSLIVEDAEGRTLPIKLGLGDGFSAFAAPAGQPDSGLLDIVGILDQEDLLPDDGNRDGYRLWVMDYNGNPAVLPEPANAALLTLAALVMLRRRERGNVSR